MLETEPRASHLLSKDPATEQFPQLELTFSISVAFQNQYNLSPSPTYTQQEDIAIYGGKAKAPNTSHKFKTL